MAHSKFCQTFVFFCFMNWFFVSNINLVQIYLSYTRVKGCYYFGFNRYDDLC